jgi:DNA-binding transcriptional ArsR family regulator
MKKQAVNDLKNMAKNSAEAAEVLKALAHPQRLMILCHLVQGEMTAGEIERATGGSQSGISQFLNRMKREGLLNSRKAGLRVFYKIGDPRVKSLIKTLQKVFCP